MSSYCLEIRLLSDATFGSGTGISGLVDNDVQHDAAGMPTISGRAIKGLLVNEAAEILYALPKHAIKDWQKAAANLFGTRGELAGQKGKAIIGTATLAPDLVAAMNAQKELSPAEVLDSLTAIRQQTAMNEFGAPKDETLRATRVILRENIFYAPLILSKAGEIEKALLAACVKALRRAGLGRNRGKGKIEVRLTDRPLDPAEFAEYEAKPKELTLEWLKPLKAVSS